MGGFEGGDEGGFWDVDAIDTLIKKQNTSLSPIKKENKVSLKQLNSAFTLSNDSTLSIVPIPCSSFTIEGCESIPLHSNAIYKTYLALIELTCDSDIEEFFTEHKVVVSEYTPSTSSTNFLLLTKELCNLLLSESELQSIKEAAL